MSYGTSPACGTGLFAVVRSKQPVCETSDGGALTGKPHPLIDARDDRPRAGVCGPLNRATTAWPDADVATIGVSPAASCSSVRTGTSVTLASQLTPPTIDHAVPLHRAITPRCLSS